MPVTFTFEPASTEPAFSIAPHTTRMVAAYADRTARIHLFTDVLEHDRDPSYDVLASWDAHIDYYAGDDVASLARVGTVAERSPDHDAVDSIGAASPGAVVVDNRVLLFYACRGPGSPASPPRIDELHGRIMLASAPVDPNGAPSGAFENHGVAVDLFGDVGSVRLDDPCAFVADDAVHLYFKAIGTGEAMENRVVCCATRPAADPIGPYEPRHEPVLNVDGGGEMPRAFVCVWTRHMLYRRFSPTGTRWGHYISDDGLSWRIRDDHVFDGAGPTPGRAATDVCPIWTPFADEPFTQALCAGLDDGSFGDAGRIKQWLYDVKTVPTRERGGTS